MNNIKDKITKWMKDTGRTKTSLAIELGVVQSAISRYVNGNRIPNETAMRRLYIISNHFISPNDFYDLPVGDDPPVTPLGKSAGNEQDIGVPDFVSIHSRQVGDADLGGLHPDRSAAFINASTPAEIQTF